MTPSAPTAPATPVATVQTGPLDAAETDDDVWPGGPAPAPSPFRALGRGGAERVAPGCSGGARHVRLAAPSPARSSAAAARPIAARRSWGPPPPRPAPATPGAATARNRDRSSAAPCTATAAGPASPAGPVVPAGPSAPRNPTPARPVDRVARGRALRDSWSRDNFLARGNAAPGAAAAGRGCAGPSSAHRSGSASVSASVSPYPHPPFGRDPLFAGPLGGRGAAAGSAARPRNIGFASFFAAQHREEDARRARALAGRRM